MIKNLGSSVIQSIMLILLPLIEDHLVKEKTLEHQHVGKREKKMK